MDVVEDADVAAEAAERAGGDSASSLLAVKGGAGAA